MGQFFVFLVVGPRDGPHIGHLFICRSSLRPPLLTPTSNAIGPPRKLQHLRFPYIWDHWAGCNTDVRTLRRTSIPLSLDIVMPSCSRILRSLLQYGCLQIAALSLQLTSIHFPCIVASHCPRILWAVVMD